jgi:hypothetical protein
MNVWVCYEAVARPDRLRDEILAVGIRGETTVQWVEVVGQHERLPEENDVAEGDEEERRKDKDDEPDLLSVERSFSGRSRCGFDRRRQGRGGPRTRPGLLFLTQ